MVLRARWASRWGVQPRRKVSKSGASSKPAPTNWRRFLMRLPRVMFSAFANKKQCSDPIFTLCSFVHLKQLPILQYDESYWKLDIWWSFFTHATLCIARSLRQQHICLSACPSVTAGIVSSRAKAGSRNVHLLIAPWFHFLAWYGSSKNSQGVTPKERAKWEFPAFSWILSLWLVVSRVACLSAL